MKTMSSEIVSFNISPKGFYELFIMKEGSAAISPETKGLETFASNNGGDRSKTASALPRSVICHC